MRAAHLFATISLLTVGAAGAWLGCSSSNNNGNNGAPDAATDHSVGSSSGGGDSGGGAGDSGGSDATSGPDGSTPVSCNAYCTAILQNCGAADGGIGGTAQYYDMTDCMSTCALMPMGTYGDNGNSVGCRQYHATLAAQDPVVHCPHAGAGGGGVCGQRCDDYCTLVMAHCTVANGADPPYGSQADCMAACMAYAYDVDASDYDPNDISTLNCLDYHLRESLSDLPGQGIDGGHCDDLSIDGGTTRGACHP